MTDLMLLAFLADINEEDEVLQALPGGPVAYAEAPRGDKWDYLLLLDDGSLTGYSGPRPELPKLNLPTLLPGGWDE